MVYKDAYLNTLLLLQSAFLLSSVKMPLKGETGGHALVMEITFLMMENHRIVFLNFCWNPETAINYSHLLIMELLCCSEYTTFFVNQGSQVVSPAAPVYSMRL